MYEPPDHVYPRSEYYAGLFFPLNTHLMILFPVNSIVRQQMGSIWPLVPVQIVINQGIAKWVNSIDTSSKFVLTSSPSGSSSALGADNGAVNEREGDEELMAKFPNFHSPRLLYLLGLFIPSVLQELPKAFDALSPAENTTFPGKAFCHDMCTSQENQGGIRLWVQAGTVFSLMMWNRSSNHRIKAVTIDATEQWPPQACRDLPEYQGNVISPRVQQAINAILTSAPIALFFNGKIVDAAIAIELDDEDTRRLFKEVGVFQYALPLFYLALSKKNWEGIFPKGEFGWGLYSASADQEGAVRYQPIARVRDTKDRMSYLKTLGSMLSALLGAIAIDETFLTSHDNQPPVIDGKHASSIVFSWFIIHQIVFNSVKDRITRRDS